VLRRSLVVVLLVLLVSACGGAKEKAVTPGAVLDTKAAIVVTSDCGQQTVLKKSVVEPGQTAMRALDTVADIETDSGGKFVTAVEGVKQDTGKKLAWLYYINGKAAAKGATEIKLAAGDVEWWDLHNYEQECAVVPPAAR
jgi:ABC-type Fe3+-hydroxamate transport system substrate-binding protein